MGGINMETKGLTICLNCRTTTAEYSIYNEKTDAEYCYTITYDSGMWENESLTRQDNKPLTDEEYSEIMDIINDIDDWNGCEE